MLLRTIVIVLVILLPLAGARVSGRGWREFLQFPPPLEIPAGYTRFSWAVAAAVVAAVIVLFAPWWFGRRAGPSGKPAAVERRTGRFPAWGLIAAGWTACWWVLAWTRFDWFAAVQRYTFFPLWLGFIVTMNAVVDARTGSCLMRRSPAWWAALFGASAACWWVFEWLNRFVANWHYLAVEDFGAVSYAVHATLCFSTVLPAVAAVAEWLQSQAGWRRIAARGPAWAWLDRRGTAVALFVGGAVALFGTGLQPRWFYPALWVAPLALLLAVEILRGERGLAREVAAADWRAALTWMVAALLCGFFWEMWNWRSLAKWIYTVPGAERWHVFEMPLLGYAGYLPFGLECLLVVRMMRRPGGAAEEAVRAADRVERR